jgi:hypothetical protein
MTNSAFNAAFAREMAKHNSPECPGKNRNYANVKPIARSQMPGSKTNSAYSKAIHDNLNNLR